MQNREKIYSLTRDRLTKDIDKYGFNANQVIILQNILNPPQLPLTLDTISGSLDIICEVKPGRRILKKIIKERLQYSYKKGSSSTLSSNNDKQKENETFICYKVSQWSNEWKIFNQYWWSFILIETQLDIIRGFQEE